MLRDTLVIIFAIFAGLVWVVIVALAGDEWGFDMLLVAALLALPLLVVYTVAAVRNGAEFTEKWAFILLGMAALVFFTFDAGYSMVLIPILSLGYIGAISAHALAYRPELGTFGVFFQKFKALTASRNDGAVERVRESGNSKINIVMVLLAGVLITNMIQIGLQLA